MIDVTGPLIVAKEDSDVFVVCPGPYEYSNHVQCKGIMEPFDF